MRQLAVPVHSFLSTLPLSDNCTSRMLSVSHSSSLSLRAGREGIHSMNTSRRDGCRPYLVPLLIVGVMAIARRRRLAHAWAISQLITATRPK
jgi:hypothetical protein